MAVQGYSKAHMRLLVCDKQQPWPFFHRFQDMAS